MISYTSAMQQGELNDPHFSIACRVLFEIIKPLCRKFNSANQDAIPSSPFITMSTYDEFYTYMRHHVRPVDMSLREILSWYKNCCKIPKTTADPIFVINLDEVNTILKCSQGESYLNTILHIIFELVKVKHTLIIPYITTTKSFIFKYIGSGRGGVDPGCIDLKLLGFESMRYIFQLFYLKCNAAGGTCIGSIIFPTLEEEQADMKRIQDRFEISTRHNKILFHFLHLFAGNPRFLEAFVITLGSDNTLQSWSKEGFLKAVEDLQNEGDSTENTTPVKKQLYKDIVRVLECAYRPEMYIFKTFQRLKHSLASIIGHSLFGIPLEGRSKEECQFDGNAAVHLEELGILFVEKGTDDNYRIKFPFIWSQYLYSLVLDKTEGAEDLISHSIAILKSMTFRLSADEFEELVTAVLALRIQAFSTNRRFSCMEGEKCHIYRSVIFLLNASTLAAADGFNMEELCNIICSDRRITYYPKSSSFQFGRCAKQITTPAAFKVLLNKVQLDRIVGKTEPPITVLVKSTADRMQEHMEKVVSELQRADYEAENDTVFLYVSDSELRLAEVGAWSSGFLARQSNAFIVDFHRRNDFFGEDLTHILKMCLFTSDLPRIPVA
jgi:hypothetical protein